MTTDTLKKRARALHLHGLLAHWQDAADWAGKLIAWEEEERGRRSLERRIQASRIGRFKPLLAGTAESGSSSFKTLANLAPPLPVAVSCFCAFC